jgi:hypothetical protein
MGSEIQFMRAEKHEILIKNFILSVKMYTFGGF